MLLCSLSHGRHAGLAKGDDKAGRTYVHGNFTCTYEANVIAACGCSMLFGPDQRPLPCMTGDMLARNLASLGYCEDADNAAGGCAAV